MSVPVAGFSISTSTRTLYLGGFANKAQMFSISTAINANILPANASNKTVHWTNSNPLVASLDSASAIPVLTGLSLGTTVVTGTTVDGGFTSSVTFTVTQYIPVSSIVLTSYISSISTGQYIDSALDVKLYPSSFTNRNIQNAYFSSINSCVAVAGTKNFVSTLSDLSGVVTGGVTGNTAINFILTEPTKYISSNNISVTVGNPALGILLSNNTVNLNPGSTITLTATVYPSKSDNKTVSWKSASPSTATVNSVGFVTGISTGKTIITAANNDVPPVIVSTIVSVGIPTTSVTLNTTSSKIQIGSTVSLIATVAPTTAANKTISWASSSPSVATVNASGLVTGVATGTALITAANADIPPTTANALITVIDIPVTNINIFPPGNVTVKQNKNVILSITLMPTTATNKTTSWASLNPAIANVLTTDGLRAYIYGISTGTTTIIVTSNQVTKRISVTVI